MRSAVIIELPEERVEKFWPFNPPEFESAISTAMRIGTLIGECVEAIRPPTKSLILAEAVRYVLRHEPRVPADLIRDDVPSFVDSFRLSAELLVNKYAQESR